MAICCSKGASRASPAADTNMQDDLKLGGVLEELRTLEPIFHTPDFGATLSEFDRRMAPDYWEVGASGHRYSREFILQHLRQNPPVDAVSAGWKTSDHAVRPLAANTFLFTYTLFQGKRVTRRSTVWRREQTGWVILYHQGTVFSADDEHAIEGSPDKLEPV